jgi:H+-transporting ATPase
MDFIKFGMRALFEPKNDLKNSKTPMAGQSRRASAISGTSSARYYANRTRSLKSLERPQNFAQKLMGNSGKKMDAKEMRRFSSVQSSNAAQVLNKK